MQPAVLGLRDDGEVAAWKWGRVLLVPSGDTWQVVWGWQSVPQHGSGSACKLECLQPNGMLCALRVWVLVGCGGYQLVGMAW